MFTAGWIAGADVCAGVSLDAGADVCAEACIAAFAAGNRLPSGLSTNFEAAPTARTAGSTRTASFLGAYEGSTNTKLLAAVLLAATGLAGVVSAAVVTGTLVFTGAGAAVCATAGADTSFSVSFSPGPGTNSYLHMRSRSTTTRVVSVASVPIRTPVTPLFPTWMRLTEVATTVFGRSTTMRAGEESVSTLGAIAPLAVISMLTPFSLCSTLTFSRAACVAASVPGVCAPATSTMASNAKIVPSSCFRISRLPASDLLKTYLLKKSRSIFLRYRPANRLGYVSRQRLPQLVVEGFFEHN